MGAQFTDVSHSCGDLASGFMALEKHCFHLSKQTDPCLMQITCFCVIHEGALSLTSSHSLPSHPPQHTSARSISHTGQVFAPWCSTVTYRKRKKQCFCVTAGQSGVVTCGGRFCKHHKDLSVAPVACLQTLPVSAQATCLFRARVDE